MPLNIPIGFAEVALKFVHSFDPDPWLVTFGIDSSAAPAGQETDALLAVGHAWVENVIAFQDSQVTLLEVVGRFGQDGDPLTVSQQMGNSGTGTGEKLPQNCALHVRKFTALGGRRGKGRMFVPGLLSRDDVSEVGILVNTQVNNYQTAFSAMLNALTVGEGGDIPTAMHILHNTEGSQPVPSPSLVTTLAVDSRISTQRRRLR